MIIFDLDGTLADCEHRRHFVDPKLAMITNPETTIGFDVKGKLSLLKKNDKKKWKPDWKAFYEACDKDKPLIHTIATFRAFENTYTLGIEIWSARCASQREKTLKWIQNYVTPDFDNQRLRMRPIGDSTPDDVLKESWLDEIERCGIRADFIFDDRPKVVRMWRRRGIFVFDVNQSGKEF